MSGEILKFHVLSLNFRFGGKKGLKIQLEVGPRESQASQYPCGYSHFQVHPEPYILTLFSTLTSPLLELWPASLSLFNPIISHHHLPASIHWTSFGPDRPPPPPPHLAQQQEPPSMPLPMPSCHEFRSLSTLSFQCALTYSLKMNKSLSRLLQSQSSLFLLSATIPTSRHSEWLIKPVDV